MWLIMFTPIGSYNFIPQVLLRSEQEARNWITNVPFSVAGSYSYIYVPIASMGNYWRREEPWQFQNYPNGYSYYDFPSNLRITN